MPSYDTIKPTLGTGYNDGGGVEMGRNRRINQGPWTQASVQLDGQASTLAWVAGTGSTDNQLSFLRVREAVNSTPTSTVSFQVTPGADPDRPSHIEIISADGVAFYRDHGTVKPNGSVQSDTVIPTAADFDRGTKIMKALLTSNDFKSRLGSSYPATLKVVPDLSGTSSGPSDPGTRYRSFVPGQ